MPTKPIGRRKMTADARAKTARPPSAAAQYNARAAEAAAETLSPFAVGLMDRLNRLEGEVRRQASRDMHVAGPGDEQLDVRVQHVHDSPLYQARPTEGLRGRYYDHDANKPHRDYEIVEAAGPPPEDPSLITVCALLGEALSTAGALRHRVEGVGNSLSGRGGRLNADTPTKVQADVSSLAGAMDMLRALQHELEGGHEAVSRLERMVHG